MSFRMDKYIYFYIYKQLCLDKQKKNFVSMFFFYLNGTKNCVNLCKTLFF